ncbi:hypothetical protein OAJ65_02830, partial [Flavobacteriales bacterium]|nr:hypothetical protein [Flavobacteriales bacterium]
KLNMLKSIFKVSAPIILIIIILIIGFNAYQKTLENTDNPLSIIPSNASVILQSNDVEALNTLLQKTTIWRNLLNINQMQLINKNIQDISTFFSKHKLVFTSNTLFISFHKVGANNNGVLFCSNFSVENISSQQKIASLLGNTLETYNYDNKVIYHLTNKKRKIYCSFKGNVIFFSSSKMLIEDVIKESATNENLLTNSNFKLSYNTISKSADINLFLNYNSLAEFTSTYTKDIIHFDNFSEWISTDIKIKDNVIIINGFGNINSPIENYTDIFFNQTIESSDIVEVIPENTAMLLAIGFDNAKLLYDKKNKLLQTQNNFWSWDKRRKQLLDSTKVNYNELIKQLENEAGRFSTFSTQSSSEQYSYFKSKNSLTTSSLMQGLIKNRKDYNGYSISKCKDPNITANLFGDLFSCHTPYFTIIDDYFIFGNSESSIQYIIDHYNGKNTLYNNEYFRSYRTYISSKSNLFFYINPGRALVNLKEKLQANYRKKMSFNKDSILNFTAFSLQLSAKRNLLLNNLSLFYDADFKEDIKEEWFLQLDSTIAMTPKFVKNHFIKQEMIVVQTKSNRLYALNAEGEIIWEKIIDSKIIGDISSIDIYKNNKYQALFNTESHLYLIDRNGKYVDGFPKKLPSHTTLGHSLFDYNNNKRYRIVIIGSNNVIYNLDAKGEEVKGWKYKKQQNRIIASAQHFKVNNKDYILQETANSTTKLLAINGTERVSYEPEATFNGSPLKIDNLGTLYGITFAGNLWRGMINGNTTELSIPEMNNQSLFALNNTEITGKNQYIITNDKSTFITDEEFEILHSFHLKEKIQQLFTSNGYIVLATSTQLYLYKKGAVVEGFPINTDGFFNISDIDQNGKINIINSKHGSLYNFELSY